MESKRTAIYEFLMYEVLSLVVVNIVVRLSNLSSNSQGYLNHRKRVCLP